MVDLRAFFIGAAIGAVIGISILLWGAFCGFRNQIREKRKRKGGRG